MERVISELIVGVVSNGLWTILAQSSGKLTRELRRFIAPPSHAAVKAIDLGIERLSKSLRGGTPAARDQISVFLRSPEVETTVRQLFATSLCNAVDVTAAEVEEQFISSLSKHLRVTDVSEIGSSIFSALVSTIEGTLQAAVENNVLAAHEAQSAARHRILLDELANLRRNLAFLTSKTELDVNAIVDFEAKYREQVACVHAQIKPPQLETGRRVPIDEIFVAPHISPFSGKQGEDEERIRLSAFLRGFYRAVLLGHPGGGKSTVSTKICHDLASHYQARFFAGREVTPALVVLREYGSQKKQHGISILQFLEQQARSRYQMEPPPNAFEYLLLNGRLLVIFDGLDELLDTSYRQEISSNVEAFCSLYHSVPVLITSREVGYDQAPLSEKVFALFRLAPFEEEQVAEYAKKWFLRDQEYSEEQNLGKAQAFMVDSAFVPDLRSNPLMLGLMCNLYRAEGYIPRNRPEVYGKCSVMLFERWDKSRDIVVPLPFEEHIRPAMQDLAYWIYSDEQLQGGVTEACLIQRTSEYLCKWVFDDAQKARWAALDFIRFCTGRAWVFTDIGTTADGERLFQFTHRTFLEYFAACYLVSIQPTPVSLLRALEKRIRKGEWDVVAQLSFQIQSKQVHGAADELLSGLIHPTSRAGKGRSNVLSFAERSLEFLVPSPQVRRDIARAALNFWLQEALSLSDSQRRATTQVFDTSEHVGNILTANVENRSTIADEF